MDASGCGRRPNDWAQSLSAWWSDREPSGVVHSAQLHYLEKAPRDSLTNPASLPNMLTLLSILTLASPPQGFAFDVQLDVSGTVAGVASPLAAPLDGITVGQPVLLHLELLASDTPCTTASGLLGYQIYASRCTLDVGSIRVGMDPMTPSCFLGEAFGSASGTTRTEMSANLESLLGSADLALEDPNGSVGISVFQIIESPLIVADITDPQFSGSFELRVPSGSPGIIIDLERIEGQVFLNSYCPVVPNSTGSPARIYATGSYLLANNDLILGAVDLPPSSFAYFLTSRTTAFFQMPGGSAGNLCLGGLIGRFVGPGEVLATGSSGQVQLPIDLTAMPQPTGPVAVMPPETWYFSVWYRDVVGTTTSNFGPGVEIQFR